MSIQEILAKHGFPYPDNLIMAFIGGSTQHGARADDCGGQSDTDYYGIFIPPKEKTLGIDAFEHFVYPGDTTKRSRGEREPGEVDIALHSLQKWAGMVAKGNPTVLSFLFSTLEFQYTKEHNDICYRCYGAGETSYDVEPCTVCDGDGEEKLVLEPWQRILDNTLIFLAKSHYWPFIYYAQDQMERLMGLRGQKNINRDKLVDLYGYDTKYAMHIIRLLSEAKELMEDGRITYPRPEVEVLKDIRRGKYKLTELQEMGEQIRAEAEKARDKSSLPEKVDRAAISKLIADVHLEFYA
jgi:hypothetical protein